jgi:hypothetical protein
VLDFLTAEANELVYGGHLPSVFLAGLNFLYYLVFLTFTNIIFSGVISCRIFPLFFFALYLNSHIPVTGQPGSGGD